MTMESPISEEVSPCLEETSRLAEVTHHFLGVALRRKCPPVTIEDVTVEERSSFQSNRWSHSLAVEVMFSRYVSAEWWKNMKYDDWCSLFSDHVPTCSSTFAGASLKDLRMILQPPQRAQAGPALGPRSHSKWPSLFPLEMAIYIYIYIYIYIHTYIHNIYIYIYL